MPKDVKYKMSKSCYLCFKTKRVLVELIVGISQSQNQGKVSCTRAKTYARTSKKSHVRELKKSCEHDEKVTRIRSNSQTYTSRKSRALERKIPRTRAEGLAHTSESHAFTREKEIKRTATLSHRQIFIKNIRL